MQKPTMHGTRLAGLMRCFGNQRRCDGYVYRPGQDKGRYAHGAIGPTPVKPGRSTDAIWVDNVSRKERLVHGLPLVLSQDALSAGAIVPARPPGRR